MCREYPADREIREARPQDFEWLQAAHVIAKRGLTGADKEDSRNGMVLCVYHHGRHDHWVERVPRALLPECAFEFVDATGLGWLLDKEYPLTKEATSAR